MPPAKESRSYKGSGPLEKNDTRPLQPHTTSRQLLENVDLAFKMIFLSPFPGNGEGIMDS